MTFTTVVGNILQPILLSLLTVTITASPISSPEILSNSGKSTGPSSQDAQLNSLNAYAANYGNLPKSTENTLTNTNFMPSYKLPPLENNFVPMQNNPTPATSAVTNSSPLLMQYVPQLMNEGGMQYLQLIPTRPLIVPISPFINGGVNPTASTYGSTELPRGNALADYAGRSAAMYTSITGQNNVHNNSHPEYLSSSIVKIPSNRPAGLQFTYGNAQPSHSRNNFRINREIKGKQPPPGLSLNINEFIPLNPEALHGLYVRGRP